MKVPYSGEPTAPEKDRPPRFGAITQLAKDAFVLELRRFFSTEERSRYADLVNIEKYAAPVDAYDDPLATAVQLFRAFPQIEEHLPTVAVLSAQGANLKLDLGRKFVGRIQHPPKVVGTRPGPFAIDTSGTLTLRTWPGGGKPHDHRFVFVDAYFRDPTSATLDEVVRCINYQTSMITAKVGWEGDDERLALAAGGVSVPGAPNGIEVVGGTPTILDALGLRVGQRKMSYDDDQRVADRYYTAANLSVHIEIAAESEHQRTELADLVYDFLAFYMRERQFTLLGRGIFDERIPGEVYQVIIKDAEIAISGDQEIPRPSDPFDKIYTSRISVPVTAIQYIDRVLLGPDGEPLIPEWAPDLRQDDTLNIADRP